MRAPNFALRLKIVSVVVCVLLAFGLLWRMAGQSPFRASGGGSHGSSILDPRYPNGEDPTKVWNGVRAKYSDPPGNPK